MGVLGASLGGCILEFFVSVTRSVISGTPGSEAPPRAEFLQKRLLSAFFGFQWQNLADILHLLKKYNNLRKVAVRE